MIWLQNNMSFFEPFCTQIFPFWIHGINKRNFLGSQPPFDLFFALYCLNVGCRQVINQILNIVLFGESWDRFVLVFMDAANQVIGDACIKRPRLVGHNVKVILLAHSDSCSCHSERVAFTATTEESRAPS
jgi:hypothetical protein